MESDLRPRFCEYRTPFKFHCLCLFKQYLSWMVPQSSQKIARLFLLGCKQNLNNAVLRFCTTSFESCPQTQKQNTSYTHSLLCSLPPIKHGATESSLTQVVIYFFNGECRRKFILLVVKHWTVSNFWPKNALFQRKS